MSRLLAAIAALALAPGLAAAAETGGCERFSWDLAAERALMAGAAPATGAEARPPVAVRLGLGSDAKALPKPPERAARAARSYAGALSVRIERAGTYRITLSGEGWVDAVQGDAYRKPVAFSGVRDCPGVRKSLKVALDAGDLIVQVSGSETDAVVLAVTADR